MTPAGVEPATFQFVAQYLNHCATAKTRWVLEINSNVDVGYRTPHVSCSDCTVNDGKVSRRRDADAHPASYEQWEAS